MRMVRYHLGALSMHDAADHEVTSIFMICDVYGLINV